MADGDDVDDRTVPSRHDGSSSSRRRVHRSEVPASFYLDPIVPDHTVELREVPPDSRQRYKPARYVGFAQFGFMGKDAREIVYFHDAPGSRLDAAYLERPALAARVRITAFSRPGIGSSTDDAQRSIRSFMHDLLRCLKSLRIGRFYALGHGAGAAYALACARYLPSYCRGVGVIAGVGPWELSARFIPDFGQRLVNHACFKPYHKNKETFDRAYGPLLSDDAEEVLAAFNDLRRELAAPDREALKDRHYARIFIQSYREALTFIPGLLRDVRLVGQEWHFSLGEIRYPGIELWYGELDEDCPLELGRELRDYIQDAHLVKYHSVGHFSIFIECGPGILADLLDKGGRPSRWRPRYDESGRRDGYRDHHERRQQRPPRRYSRDHDRPRRGDDGYGHRYDNPRYKRGRERSPSYWSDSSTLVSEPRNRYRSLAQKLANYGRSGRGRRGRDGDDGYGYRRPRDRKGRGRGEYDGHRRHSQHRARSDDSRYGDYRREPHEGRRPTWRRPPRSDATRSSDTYVESYYDDGPRNRRR